MPKLLIVDGEPNVLYSFERAFAPDALEICCVETGADAVEAVAADRPDAVVLDVRLPDMSGLEVFEQIQSLDARLPVIFITAHSTTDTAIHAMKRGAFEYLLKPVDIHELRDLVHKALEISRLRHVPAVLPECSAAVRFSVSIVQSPYRMSGDRLYPIWTKGTGRSERSVMSVAPLRPQDRSISAARSGLRRILSAHSWATRANRVPTDLPLRGNLSPRRIHRRCRRMPGRTCGLGSSGDDALQGVSAKRVARISQRCRDV